MNQAQDAFRFVSQGRHVGKVVLTVPPPLDPNGTVLITGGTGGLGMVVARHLACTRGVRHLLLVSRRGSAAAGVDELATELAELGAAVEIVACDVGDQAAVTELLRRIPANRPLTAVVYAAGIIDDGVVESLTPGRMDAVLAAKAYALH